MKAAILAAFRELYGEDPRWLVRAPGRVNLIGDHTDYNAGFVLPMAIERAAWVALRPRSDRRVVLRSLDFEATAELDLASLEQGANSWIEYVKAVAWALSESGQQLSGWEGVVAGDVPIGSGLSSSAAFEVAIARAFALASELTWQPTNTARLMQRAENGWVGVASGIMDPLISAVAQAGHATLIDCRDLALRQVSVPSSATVVIMNTMKRRGLVTSAYNERRQQCEDAARHFGVATLRDVSLPSLEAAQGDLDAMLFKRARHVVTENQRVLSAAAALASQDLIEAGRLMTESHASLRDDFEVSCVELDAMVAAALRQPGCWGARMTGAGFGGCAVALVHSELTRKFIGNVQKEYEAEFDVLPDLLTTRAAEGASLESF